MKVRVTHHALERWRERVASYADEGEEELRKAFSVAVPVDEDEHLPFARVDGSRYFRLNGTRIYFVTEAVDVDEVRIVTVRDLDSKSVTITPKKKKTSPDKMPDDLGLEKIPPFFPDVATEREWLTAHADFVKYVMTRMTKSHPWRDVYAWRKRMVNLRLKKLTEENP